MKAPRCGRCQQVVSWSIGLPVSVSFNEDGTVGTISVDTGELADSDGWAGCDCEHHDGPELTEEDEQALYEALDYLARNYAPEVEGSLP